MKIWDITRRWVLNSLGTILLVHAALILYLSLVMQGYVYNSIQQTINGRSSESTNVFAGYGSKTTSEPSSAARAHVENSPSKQTMEMMVLNTSGRILATPTGSPPDQGRTTPNIQMAQASRDDYGTWQSRLPSDEEVMAVTREIRSQVGSLLSSIRYIASLKEANRQILTIVGGLLAMGFLVILFVVSSSSYFIKSIVDSIKLISATAKWIAQGDFDARIRNRQEDEIGELCEAINKMAVELGTTEKMGNDFISSVLHELRMPLVAIKGRAKMLRGMDETGRETYEKGMGVIIRESERLSGIVEEFLDFSRVQSGRMMLMMDKIDILVKLSEAMYLFIDRAQAESKSLVYEEPPLLPPILGDANRLWRVLANIIGNALKYTKEGNIVTVTVGEVSGKIRIVISDTGCGISTKNLPNVKEKFYKANQTMRGSEIGLALADEIMYLHDGRPELENQEGVGAVVIVTIPILKQSAPETEPAPATEERNSERNG